MKLQSTGKISCVKVCPSAKYKINRLQSVTSESEVLKSELSK